MMFAFFFPQQQLQLDDEMELLPAKRNNVENEQLTLISDYKVIHSSILQQIVESVSKCKHCNRENTAQVFQENSKKKRVMWKVGDKMQTMHNLEIITLVQML